jgi:3-hydroxybutyryl-CoA dehydrogenase
MRRIGVIGGGTMGSGIAEVAAKNGCGVVVVEVDDALAEAAMARLQTSSATAVERSKMTEDEHDQLWANLTFTTSYDELADADLVVEAVIEIPEVKFEVFRKLDSVVKPEGILASNTSSIPIVEIGAVTGRPEQVLGMHFFNPATVQPLVELIQSQQTSDATMDAVDAFCTDTLGKHPIRTGDRAGFVVNRLLVPYLLQAMEMFDRGQATKEDIDAGMRFGCAHPMGPLELSDLIGLDTMKLVADVLYEEFKEPLYAPPAILKRMVSAGQLGRKVGRGFYDYEERRREQRN